MENNVVKTKDTSNLEVFTLYRNHIDETLRAFLDKQRNYDMYKHMSYFLGFLDEKLDSIPKTNGKRFRPGLMLLLADYYDDFKVALAPALSIELFHNFTLIHDDIVDNDELRRGRPTVWKLWGKDHAINSGDAQLMLANIALTDSSIMSAETTLKLQQFLNERYLEVAEGQFLDFSLATYELDDERLSKDKYMEMITKKSAVLVGAAAAASGISTDQSKEEIDLLYEYGLSLGVAYQLRDDVSSIWEDSKTTGKNSFGDIIEKKKTLPILYAFEKLSDVQKRELCSFYRKEILSKEDIGKVVSLLKMTDVREYMEQEILEYANRAREVVKKLSISDEQREILYGINRALLSL